MFYFRSRHGLACRWPPRQACLGSRFWCRGSPYAPPDQPKIASSSRSVAPFSAARVAAALRMPRADFPTTPAGFGRPHEFGSRSALSPGRAPPGDDEGEVAGRPCVGNSGSSTRIPVFSLSIEIGMTHQLPIDQNRALLQVLAVEDRDVADPQAGVGQGPASWRRSPWMAA